MNMLILLALMLPSAGAPASSTFTATAVTAHAFSPDVGITSVLVVPAPSRGLGRVGRGRGLAKLGTGRGLAKLGTDRGLAKMGTNRSLGKFGTGRSVVNMGKGRGFAKLGSSEPMIDPASTTQGEVVPEPPLPEKGADPAANMPDPQASKDDPSFQHKPVHPAPLVVQKEKFLPHVRELITQGDRNMVDKNYAKALDQYFVAQQAEGLSGQSMMRLSGSLIAVGRHGDAIYQLKYYVEGGGRIYQEGFGFPQDESLEKRMADQLALNPFNTDLLMSKAVYHYSRGETSHASQALASLRRLNPYHSCLKPLEKAVEKAAGKDGADDPDAGNQGDP